MDDVALIENIIRYCKKIRDAVDRFGNDEWEFNADPQFHDVCSFYITQIGESAGDLSQDIFEKYPDIHWKGLVGMRNVIAHGYHGIDIARVWLTVVEEVPVLKETCEKILKELKR